MVISNDTNIEQNLSNILLTNLWLEHIYSKFKKGCPSKTLNSKHARDDGCYYSEPRSRQFTLRLVSTQENKHRIGSDWTFSNLYYPHRRTKKVENTSTFCHRIVGSNWNRKFAPKAYSLVQFCSDPVRSHAYFPEWKPAFSEQADLYTLSVYDMCCNVKFLSFRL